MQPKHVVGTQKNRFNKLVLLAIQNVCLKLWVRKYLLFYAQNKPVFFYSMSSQFKATYESPGGVAQSVTWSDCRYVSDCRIRGREFDPGPVPYLDGDWSSNNFYCHSPFFRWFKKGCCQLQAKVCARSTGFNQLVKLAQEKKIVSWTDRPNMTKAVDWDVKNQTKQTKPT